MKRPFPSGIAYMRAAFTLVELMVVISIIAVLVVLAFPAAEKVKESANRTKCVGNLRSLGRAVALFTSENGVYPSGISNTGLLISGAILPYLNSGDTDGTNTKKNLGNSIFECPSRALKGGSGDPNISYSGNVFIFITRNVDNPPPEIRPARVLRPSETVLFTDACQRNNTAFTAGPCLYSLESSSVVKKTMGAAPHSFSKADVLLDDGPDVDGTSVSYIRFRHGEHLNAVHADGSVRSYGKGLLKQRNFSISY